MYKLHFTIFALLTAILFATAQTETTINLPFSRCIEFENGKWGEWPKNWNPEFLEDELQPVLTIKQIDEDTFDLRLTEAWSASDAITDRVHFDAAETKRVRKKTNNDNITVYKYYETRNSLWMENVSLPQIVSDQTNWISISDMRMYIWHSDLGIASIYKFK